MVALSFSLAIAAMVCYRAADHAEHHGRDSHGFMAWSLFLCTSALFATVYHFTT